MRDPKTAKEMEMMISISRVHGGDEPYIAVEITDDSSGITFTRLKMSMDDFARAVTGQSYIHCRGEANGLDKVGKKHKHKEFTFELPKSVYEGHYHKKNKVVEIAKKKCPKGWTPDTSFNSQNSFFKKGDKCYAKTTIRRWV